MPIDRTPQVGGRTPAVTTDPLPVPRAVEPSRAKPALLPSLRPAAPRRSDALQHQARLGLVDASLQRTATHLLATQQVDGRWDTLYRGGNAQMALTAIALADCGASVDKARDSEVIAHFAQVQQADGGFSTIAGEPSDAATTRLVSVALTMMAQRQPALAAQCTAIADKCQELLRDTPSTPGDGVYALLSHLICDLVCDSDAVPNVPLLAPLTDFGASIAGDRLSGIARIYVPAFALLMEQQAREGSWLAHALGTLTEGSCKDLEAQLMASQDGDGAWAWTALGTALALMALKRQGHTIESTRAMRRGVEFLERLRGMDITAWTRGDAWDTAFATLTLQTIAPASSEAVARGVDQLMHGQLQDGRFSFSLLGVLGDDDTTSVTLRAMCARYAKTDNAEERGRLRAAIVDTTEGLLEYQRRQGGWGAFNKRSLLGISPTEPPTNPSISAFNDMQSPDLTGRVLSSLVEARRRGALSPELASEVDSAVSRAAAYLRDARNSDGSWWSRWSCGALSGFAYIVPALRRAGEPASSPVFKGIAPLLLSQQNADGGWGEEIAADRAARHAGTRGRSSIAHTASAIIGLIGTAGASDPQVRQALSHAADYLLKNENAGAYTNGRNIYTQLTGLDYYDCDNWTTCLAAAALQLYRDYVRLGPGAAMQRYAL